VSKLFQIYEDDLATLEADVPKLIEGLISPNMTNAQRVKIRRVKEILSNVRWNYGPPGEVEEIPTGDEP